jgi:hypothetical protein
MPNNSLLRPLISIIFARRRTIIHIALRRFEPVTHFVKPGRRLFETVCRIDVSAITPSS